MRESITIVSLLQLYRQEWSQAKEALIVASNRHVWILSIHSLNDYQGIDEL